ncbi:MAG: UDP-N-acetylmuramoyl-L-alanine--D-glutamate ligase [Acidobacteria bacterium]|nr:UDP-N-acetylmuramoyl-L-alanine--D-glutamate ligase [Acidobacteriota bacterium]
MTLEPESIAGKRVLVVGMARSGMAAARFLRTRGAWVTVSDTRGQSRLVPEIRTLQALGIGCEVGGHRLESLLEAEFIVVSPGVPLDQPLLREAARQGREILSEIELASRFLRGRVVGITGSNGKTTTTTLVGEILESAGFRVQVGGNIGVPLISLVESSASDSINVVELSSFQLEAVSSFRAHIGVILNITPDHMDRYPTLAAYASAKLNLLNNQASSDFAVLNREDRLLRDLDQPSAAKRFWFSTRVPVDQGCCLQGDALVFSNRGRREQVVPVEDIRIKGRHNLENVAAAVTVARLLGASVRSIRETVARFRGVSHRLEWVREIRGVDFYNDSKATNPTSAQKALEAFEQRLILILGGRDKAGDFTVLSPQVSRRVKGLVLLGEASRKIESQLAGTAPVARAASMEEAVRLAFGQADRGEVVLLAPACSSFDMFRDYEDRGNVFKEAVNRLR